MNKIDSDYIRQLVMKECSYSIDDNTKFSNLDIDSLSLLSICSEIEDKYKISLISSAKDINDLNIKNKSFKDFIEYIQYKVDEQTKT